MINISKEQIKELDGVYQMSHRCKDSETKKLAKAIFNTIEFDDAFKNLSIDTGYYYYTKWIAGYGYGPQSFEMAERKKFMSLPIVVILYLITKDDKYLKPSRYVKGFQMVGNTNRSYIKFSNICYFIDQIFIASKADDFFKVEK